MSTYDKSGQHGYDAQDKDLMVSLRALQARDPREARRVQNRVHDGILARMKEEATRKCHGLIQQMEKCVNSDPLSLVKKICVPHKDAVNECFKSVHTEQRYQELRASYLRGELNKYREERLQVNIESLKSLAPDTLPQWKIDYIDKYTSSMEDIGAAPSANIPIIVGRSITHPPDGIPFEAPAVLTDPVAFRNAQLAAKKERDAAP